MREHSHPSFANLVGKFVEIGLQGGVLQMLNGLGIEAVDVDAFLGF